VVYVVAKTAGRDINNQPMHLQIFARSIFAVRQRMHGVISMDAFIDVPFVLSQPLVIFGINDGEFALRQRDSAKGIAVANPPISERDRN